MNLVNPWDNVKINPVHDGAIVQKYDQNIHILYVLNGSVDLKFDEKYLTLQKNDFLIMDQAVIYEVTFREARLFSFELNYEFSVNQSENQSAYIFVGNSVANASANDQEVTDRLEKLLQLYVYQAYRQNAYIFENYFALIGILEKYYRKKVSLDNNLNIKQKIKELKFYIDHNFEKDIKLSDLARKLYLSEPYLSRLFTSEIGMPLTEYLVKKRLEKVTNDLVATEISITEIAFSAGFSSINSFNRIFKKYYDVTPSTYR